MKESRSISITAANQACAAALKAARAKDSELKPRRALTALEALEATGASITFTAVAQAAGAPSWLVYARRTRRRAQRRKRKSATGHQIPKPCTNMKHPGLDAHLVRRGSACFPTLEGDAG
jgi:hypothetical protein